MGSRANFVVVDSDGWRLYFSKGAASGIDVLLAAGPEAAMRFINAPAACEPVTGWLDDIWAEGGAVIDHAARQLIFYGGHVLDEIPVKRVFFDLLARTWPGWQLSWAFDGIGDLAAHVGVDRQVARDPAGRSGSRMPEELTEHLDWSVHLVTVRSATGTLAVYPFHEGHQTAWLGPAMLDRLPGPGLERLELPQLPGSGLHIDMATRQVGVWITEEGDGLVPALDDLWPGWTVTFWGDRYEEQLALCDDAVTMPPVDPAATIGWLARHLEGLRDQHWWHGRTRGVTKPQLVAPTDAEWDAVRAAIATLR